MLRNKIELILTLNTLELTHRETRRTDITLITKQRTTRRNPKNMTQTKRDLKRDLETIAQIKRNQESITQIDLLALSAINQGTMLLAVLNLKQKSN